MHLTPVCIEYEPRDHETWRQFHGEYFARIRHLESLVHPYYRENISVLESLSKGIPSLHDIDAILAPIGWRATYVDGYAAPWLVARFLARRIMPLSRQIRPPQEVFFANEPDLIHDLFGHLPALLSPSYRQLLRRWAKVAAQESVTELDRTSFHLNKLIVQSQDHVPKQNFAHLLEATQALSAYVAAQPSRAQIQDRIYFWIFEFGMVEHRSERKVLGAGIISSLSELEKIATKPITTKPLTPTSFLASYNISSEQNEYLVVKQESDYFSFLDTLAPKIEPRAKAHANFRPLIIANGKTL